MKSDLLYLHHIREQCGRVHDCVQPVSPELREALTLPWRRTAGLRDVLIHDCPNLDLERIWLVASRDVPELLRAIDGFLRERGLEPGSGPSRRPIAG